MQTELFKQMSEFGQSYSTSSHYLFFHSCHVNMDPEQSILLIRVIVKKCKGTLTII